MDSNFFVFIYKDPCVVRTLSHKGNLKPALDGNRNIQFIID